MVERVNLTAKEIDAIRVMLAYWYHAGQSFKTQFYGQFGEKDMENLERKMINAAAKSLERHRKKK
jgi:hypothetical protein